MSSRPTRARHFVCILLSACVLSTCQYVNVSLADEFREVSDGNFVRLGEHTEITPDSHRGIANIGFIVGAETVAIIDPGGSADDAHKLLEAIRSRSSLPISHVILTHFHPDHVLAGQVFEEVSNVVAHRRYSAAMAQRGDHYLGRFGGLMSPVDNFSWLSPNVEVNESISINLGERKLLIVAHPTGHTDNDITVLDQKTNTLWASDLVFETRVPALDGSLTGWLEVLDNLEQTQPGLVVPGHGTPGNWTETAGPQQKYLQALLGDTREAINAGLSLSDTLAKLEHKTSQDWALYKLYHTRNVTKAYAELEWE